MLVVMIGVGCGLGAMLRFLVDKFISSHIKATIPLGTIIVNVTASFLVGLLSALVMQGFIQPSALPFLSTGFLGGYSTFSTALIETVRLVQKGHYTHATVHCLGMVVSSSLACFVGMMF